MNSSRGLRQVCGGLLGLAVFSGTGCLSVGPDYQRPETKTPDAWNRAVTQDLESGRSPVVTWWDLFQDPQLSLLIQDAAQSNLDLKAVLARLEAAEAQYGVARSRYWPTVQGTGFAGATRTSEDTVPVLPEGIERESPYYQLGADFAWELDLWGRVRRIVESSRASYQAAEEAYRDALVVLFSQVTLTYIDVRTLQQRIIKLEENIARTRETLDIVRNRNLAGLVPDLNVAQAERDLAVAEASLPELQAALFAAMNRLGVLTGREPSALHSRLSEPLPIPQVPAQVEVGLPAELLRQRPDIRQRERELAAQNARIGVAQAEFYPIFSLPGTLSLEAVDADNLFSGGSVAYSFGPAFRWNLFAGGRVRQTVRFEEARTKELLARYEQQVLLALEEVETSLSDLARERERQKKLNEAAAAARRTMDMSMVLYRSGLTDFQNVLDAQRILIAQESDLADSAGRLCANLVRLYKALGGGWQVAAPEPVSSPAETAPAPEEKP
jgi:NodT family efflux transporter outer membrane factor (OMF) lipoprotein